MNDTSVITIEPETKASTALATIESTDLTAVFITPGGLDAIVTRIEDDARSQAKNLDASTEKNRKALASLRYKVARSKTALDDAGKALNESRRAEINAVDADRRSARERLDALAAEIAKPLEDYKVAEAARVKANENAIAAMEALVVGLADLTADEIKERYRQAGIVAEFEWAIEFTARAQRVQAGVVAQLQVAHRAAKQRETEAAAEAVRLAEEAERQRLAAIQAQKEREEQIARDAAEAARLAAEARAAREAEDARLAAQREQEASAQRERDAAQALAQAERDKQEAEQRAQRLANEAEAARVDGHQEALAVMRKLATLMIATDPVPAIDAKIGQLAEEFDRDWEEFADEAAEVHQECLDSLQAKRAHSVHAAEISAQQDRDRAAAQAKRDADAAVEAERRRMEQVRAAEEAERARQAEAERVAAEKRAANRAHQAKINGEVLVDIVAALAHSEIDYDDGPDIATQIAKAIITAAAKNEIRHCSISY